MIVLSSHANTEVNGSMASTAIPANAKDTKAIFVTSTSYLDLNRFQIIFVRKESHF